MKDNGYVMMCLLFKNRLHTEYHGYPSTYLSTKSPIFLFSCVYLALTYFSTAIWYGYGEILLFRSWHKPKLLFSSLVVHIAYTSRRSEESLTRWTKKIPTTLPT
uniref:Uncharacterized protein n=1 Tax=Cacopsylla melanoneura TaxID=428564 RepID=A0A8D8Z4T7_9HEMI